MKYEEMDIVYKGEAEEGAEIAEDVFDEIAGSRGMYPCPNCGAFIERAIFEDDEDE